MPYRYLDDIAPADAAFEVSAETVEQLFLECWEAALTVMVEDAGKIDGKILREIQLEADALDMLLYDFLNRLIYYKDADSCFFRIEELGIEQRADTYHLEGTAFGEKINPDKHSLGVDVKAVTLHRFKLEQTENGWVSTVVLDI